MARRDRMDAVGASALTGFSIVLAYNQVVIKVVNGGIQPVFSAGLRSVAAFFVLSAVFLLMRYRIKIPRSARAGLAVMSVCFGTEFIFLYLALDLTTVARASVIFYSMPIWMALGAHLWIEGDRLNPIRLVGLLVAMAGVAWAILDRSGGGEGALVGDFCALAAALLWAGVGLAARATGARDASPQAQLMVQLAFSGVLMVAVAPLFGPLIRDLAPIHLWGMAFQIFVVASTGFLFWLWILTIYPASGVASFSFLTPIFSVFLGWWLLGEAPGSAIFGALFLVSLGLVLINRRRAA